MFNLLKIKKQPFSRSIALKFLSVIAVLLYIYIYIYIKRAHEKGYVQSNQPIPPFPTVYEIVV